MYNTGKQQALLKKKQSFCKTCPKPVFDLALAAKIQLLLLKRLSYC